VPAAAPIQRLRGDIHLLAGGMLATVVWADAQTLAVAFDRETTVMELRLEDRAE
jgi:preprotein translocase subunit YajC